MSDAQNQEIRLPFIPGHLDDLGLTPQEFRIVCRVSRRGECSESMANIAAGCGLHLKTVRRLVRRLQALRVIEVSARPGITTILRLGPPLYWLRPQHATQTNTLPNPIPGYSDGYAPTQSDTPHPTLTDTPKGSPIKVLPKGKRIRAVFIKPSMEEVEAYFREIGVQASEASRFHDHHESKGWVIGKSPMRDWRAACRNWKRMGVEFGRIKESTSQHSSAPSAALSQKEIKQRKLAESL